MYKWLFMKPLETLYGHFRLYNDLANTNLILPTPLTSVSSLDLPPMYTLVCTNPQIVPGKLIHPHPFTCRALLYPIN